jgi:hypothetical protein
MELLVEDEGFFMFSMVVLVDGEDSERKESEALSSARREQDKSTRWRRFKTE